MNENSSSFLLTKNRNYSIIIIERVRKMKIYVDERPDSPETCLFSKSITVRDDWGNSIGECFICAFNDGSNTTCNCKECKNLIVLGE